MLARVNLRSSIVAATALALVSLGAAAGGSARAAADTMLTTAWHDGRFAVDPAGVVSRSDIVLGQPDYAPQQYMPLGNGRLGAAVWAANGFTAQLNRADTFPDRKSPGQVMIPGLAKMTAARDFSGRLDVYDGVLTESGGGMTMRAWVLADTDQLVVDVTGADPGAIQTASVNLWSGRSPAAQASGATALLAETWTDSNEGNSQPGASGETFGSLAAITAGGRDVQASASGLSARVSFKPDADGSFRIVVAAPHWAGGDAMAAAQSLLTGRAQEPEAALTGATSAWWHGFWARAGLMEMNSADGSAQYLEKVRTLYLYTEAASMRSALPGSQAGVADMFNFSQDHQDWYPAGYWFWNLRMQAAANQSSGNFALNIPLFNLYLSNLANIQAWTRQNMGGRPGICVPETMRFNGNGYYAPGWAVGNASCDQDIPPSYNSLTITSGTELSLWVWQQYQDTGDLAFLRKYYPLMQQSAIFLLADAAKGPDGLLHTVANAHENQWDVQDPTTDIAAMQALFPAVAQAAGLLHTDASLARELTTAAGELPPVARTDEATHTQLLTPAADASGTDVIGDSYQPTAPLHNVENTGLELVWPYSVIGDDTKANGDNLTALADRTYAYRPNVNNPDWTFDAVDAARLDMAGQVKSDLIAATEKYQLYPSGMAAWNPSWRDEPYIEQSGVAATALDEALATQYDGTLRFAPAWPSDWDVSGTVYVQDNTRVDVQVEHGTLATAAIEAGASHAIRIRNPWPGQQAQVADCRTGATVVAPTTAAAFTLNAQAGHSYLVERPADPTTSLPFAQVTGTAPTAASHLGGAQIGLDPPVHYSSLAAAYNNAGITDDSNTGLGNFDGNGASFSAQALAAAGASPGATISSSGMSFTFPDVAPGANDNVVADNQWVSMSGSGKNLGFLISASYGPATGTGQILYTDGSSQSYTLTSPDWWSTTPPAGGAVAVSSAYQNRPGNTTYNHSGDIFSVAIPLDPSKTVAAVILPAVGLLASGTPALHVFAMAVS